MTTSDNVYTFDEVKRAVSCDDFLARRGKVKSAGGRYAADWRGGTNPDSVEVGVKDGVSYWYDYGCPDASTNHGSVIDLCMMVDGVKTPLDAVKRLGDEFGVAPISTKRKRDTHTRKDSLLHDGYKLVKTYTYADETGTPCYYVDRYERTDTDGRRTKEFIQRTEHAENIKDVPRRLYNLPAVIKADEVYLVEGEKDADTLNALGFVATTNSGGCGFWTPDLAAWLKGKSIIVVADNDDAGKRGAERRAASLVGIAASVKLLTVSSLPKGDVTDWMEREEGTANKLREAVANAAEYKAVEFERFGHKIVGDSVDGFDTYGREVTDIEGCGSFFVTVNAGRESIRAAVERNAAEITKRIVEQSRRTTNCRRGVNILPQKLCEIQNCITVMWLRSRGKLFWNDQTKQHDDSLFFDNESCQLFAIESDIFQSRIANMTDISRSGQHYKALHALLHDAAVCPDVAEGVTPSKYYDRRANAIYISNGDSHMVRVTANDISKVVNGTDGVVFLTGATLPAWELLEGGGEDPFDAAPLFADAWYLTPNAKMLLRLWYLCIFAKHPKRPPLLITAPFKSGKTMLFDGINLLLANRPEANAEITDTPQGKVDFWTAIHAGGLYCIDNADSRVSWLTDTLQRVSTGSALPKRKLYRDDILVCLHANADIVVTSNNPRFADDCGLSDRFIIVRLEKRGDRVSRDAELREDLLRRRNAALTWTVRTLQRALATKPDTDVGGRINGRHPDFAVFALQCAEGIGKRREAEEALRQAEFDKTLIVLQNAEIAGDILAFLRTQGGKWSGKASDLAQQIWSDLGDDPQSLRRAGTDVAKEMRHYREQFLTCFKFRTTNNGGVTLYHFDGIDGRLAVS